MPSFPIGIVSDEKIVFFSLLINPILTKFVWSRWLDSGLVFLFLFFVFCFLFFFSEVMDVSFLLVHKHAQKELCQFSAIFASSLVNNHMHGIALAGLFSSLIGIDFIAIVFLCSSCLI